jgi:hypothetical protein
MQELKKNPNRTKTSVDLFPMILSTHDSVFQALWSVQNETDLSHPLPRMPCMSVRSGSF